MADIVTIPAWYDQFQSAYVAGEANCFIFHGDLNTYLPSGVPTRRFLVAALTKLRAEEDGTPIVLSFDIATGIRFADDGRKNPRMRQAAIQALTGGQVQQKQANPALAALGLDQAAEADADPFATTDPLAALRSIDALLRTEAGAQTSVILDEADKIIPAGDVATMGPAQRTSLVLMKVIARDEQIANIGGIVFLLTEDLAGIHQEVRAASSGWRSISLPLPDNDQRAEFIRFYLGRKPEIVLAPGMDAQGIARLTAGLNLKHIEEVMLRGTQDGGVSPETIKSRKDEIISSEYAEVAEMLDPIDGGLAMVGGNEHVKDYIRQDVIDPMTSGIGRVPKGVLLVGPPGTGKTYMVRAMASELGMNAVALRSERIQSSLVGSSERALARFLRFVLALAPTLVFIDEIDQSDFSRRGTNSGNPVAANLFSQMLQFMSDDRIRGKVLVVMASNRPDLLDDAFQRMGRVDAIIPVMLPEQDDRQAIVQVHIKAEGSTASPEALAALVSGTERYSGADIQAIVYKAAKVARRDRSQTPEGLTLITQAHAERALDTIRPNTPRIASKYEADAIRACNDLDLLPVKYRQAKLEQAEEDARTMVLDDEPETDPASGLRRRRKIAS